jgi:methionine synthase II (cobalamin-independent)
MNVAIADPGAVADLTASLAEGAAAFVGDVAKRVPGARLVVQFDEPALPAVAEGTVPTASGLSRIAAVEAHTLQERLEQVLASTQAYTVVHCCAPSVPFGLIRAAGADGVSFDLSQLRRGDEDRVAESAEAGLGLLAGAVPAVPDQAAADVGAAGAGRSGGQAARAGGSNPADGSGQARQTAERVIRLWRRLGLSLATCAEQAVITPACGLAGVSPAEARAALTRCHQAASMLPELIEETGGEVG